MSSVKYSKRPGSSGKKLRRGGYFKSDGFGSLEEQLDEVGLDDEVIMDGHDTSGQPLEFGFIIGGGHSWCRRDGGDRAAGRQRMNGGADGGARAVERATN